MSLELRLVSAWVDHCREVGHTTQGEVIESGGKPDPEKYATFTMSMLGDRVYCCAPGCKWRIDFENLGAASGVEKPH